MKPIWPIEGKICNDENIFDCFLNHPLSAWLSKPCGRLCKSKAPFPKVQGQMAQDHFFSEKLPGHQIYNHTS
jgi:hypothetical protein